jgi:hypothetical protein
MLQPSYGARQPERQEPPRLTGTNILPVLVAGLGSFMFGYSNNIIAGSLAQTSFIEKFLSGENADSLTNGILGGQVANYHLIFTRGY